MTPFKGAFFSAPVTQTKKSFIPHFHQVTDIHPRIPEIAPLSSKQGSTLCPLCVKLKRTAATPQKSTGPTSVTGKAASSMNALKSGLHAKSLLLPNENPAELDELLHDVLPSFHPTTPEARCLVDEFIRCEWSLRRFRRRRSRNVAHQDDSRVPRDRAVCPRILRHPARRTPSPDSSTASTPPAAPANAPSSPSNNSRPKPQPPLPRPTRSPNRPNRLPTVPNPLTPNHFTRNWLRSANPLRGPARALDRAPEPPPRTPSLDAGHPTSRGLRCHVVILVFPCLESVLRLLPRDFCTSGVRAPTSLTGCMPATTAAR